MDKKIELQVINITNSQAQVGAFAMLLGEVNGETATAYHHRPCGSPGYSFISERSKNSPSVDTRFIYNKPYYTGSQPDTCIDLQS